MSIEAEVQRAIRARLVANLSVTSLVPIPNILDRNERPAPRPSIIIGEEQMIDEGRAIARDQFRVFHTLHVWTTEPSTEISKAISSAVRAALFSRLDLGPNAHAIDSYVSAVRTMRDPDGESVHGVLTVDVLAQEVAE